MAEQNIQSFDWARLYLPAVLFVAGLYVQSWRVARQNESELIADHIGDLIEFSKRIEEYWIPSESDEGTAGIRAAKVRAAQESCLAFFGDAERILGKRTFPQYSENMMELIDDATGGEFEVATKPFDPGRAVSCARKVSAVKQMLRLSRGESKSLLRWLRRFLP